MPLLTPKVYVSKLFTLPVPSHYYPKINRVTAVQLSETPVLEPSTCFGNCTICNRLIKMYRFSYAYILFFYVLVRALVFNE